MKNGFIRRWIQISLVVMGIVTVQTCSARPQIIAHRGASAECPENTLASVKRAWELNADAVEIDVHPTADGRAIVIHDATTSRTTGKDYVVSATASSILRQLDAGTWKGPAFAGEKLPFLEEVMATRPPKKTLFIELKGDHATVPAVCKVLQEHSTTTGIVVISFNLEMLRNFNKQFPSIPANWLGSTMIERGTRKSLPHPTEWLDQAAACGIEGVDVHYAGIHKDFVTAAKKKNLQVFVWTVNDLQTAQSLAEMGVDGITTDKPGELLSHFDFSAR